MIDRIALAALALLISTSASAQDKTLTQVEVANAVLQHDKWRENVSYAIIGSAMTMRYLADNLGRQMECPPNWSFEDAARAYAAVVITRARDEAWLSQERLGDSQALGHFAFMATTEYCRSR